MTVREQGIARADLVRLLAGAERSMMARAGAGDSCEDKVRELNSRIARLTRLRDSIKSWVEHWKGEWEASRDPGDLETLRHYESLFDEYQQLLGASRMEQRALMRRCMKVGRAVPGRTWGVPAAVVPAGSKWAGWLPFVPTRAASFSLSQATEPQNPWPPGSAERRLWPVVKHLEQACRALGHARAPGAEDWNAAYEFMSREFARVEASEQMTRAEKDWVRKAAITLCDLPPFQTVTLPPIHEPPPPTRWWAFAVPPKPPAAAPPTIPGGAMTATPGMMRPPVGAGVPARPGWAALLPFATLPGGGVRAPGGLLT